MLRSISCILFGLFFIASDALAVADITATKTAQRLGRQVVYQVVVENTGDEILNSVSATDDLDTTFGPGNYTLISGPTLLEGPATIALDAGYDGSSNTQLLTGTLGVGERARLVFTIEVSLSGVFANTLNASAVGEISGSTGDTAAVTVDTAAIARIGAAKAATLNGNQVTLDFVVANYGNRDLMNVSLLDDLDLVFGAGQYSIVSPPTVLSGTGVANPTFNGSSDTNLLAPSSTLAVGAATALRMVLNLTPADVGHGLGVYENQALAGGATEFGDLASDLSNQGSDPDPNGNNVPTEDTENVPTAIVLSEQPVIGVAKTASVAGSVVTFDIYLENLGNVQLNDISLPDDLNAVFGAGNYYVSSAPAFIDNPGTLTLNPTFDGNFETQLIDSGSLATGDTAQIRFQVTVVAIADIGLGLGQYENSIVASAFAPAGGYTEDLSDEGTDPDPNGNGDPGDADEDDATAVSIAPVASLGIAKRYVSGGDIAGTPLVYLYFTISNLGNQTISSITVSDNLNVVYGAGNFSHYEDPTHVSGSPTLTYNASFNGNTNTSMLTNGYLDPGESATFRIAHRVTNITDQGFGLGIYQNQVTVNGLDPLANPVSDLSHEGADPDPNSNGDATEPGENDPTVIDVNQSEEVGVALDVSVAGNQVTFDAYLENLGSVSVSGISLFEQLDPIFGAGNYFISTYPYFVDDPGTILLDPAFDGITNGEMIDAASSTLAAGDTAQISFTVTVTNVANAQGLGLGNYSSQLDLRALSSQGVWLYDASDFGTDPDPNGNGIADEGGENDATTFSLALGSVAGVAKSAAISGFNVTFDLYLENLGVGSLSALSLVDDLDATFGAGNYTISAVPSLISDPGTLVLNGAFDGSADPDLLDPSSTLNAGATAQIQFQVLVHTESDQGSGYGVYQNQAVISAQDASGLVFSDLSDDGTDPDPNGNSDPGEAGEDDVTPVVIVGNPAVGIAHQVLMDGTLAHFEFTIENLGDVTLTNFFLDTPLNGVFGSGNYNIMIQPNQVEGPGTLLLSPQYFGFNIFSRIVLGGSLRPGEKETIRTSINITNVTDQGLGFGIYQNQVTVTATDPGGNLYQDVSDAGFEPDANGNGDAGDTGEDDATDFAVGDENRIGVAKSASVTGQQVTFDLYLENLGASTISNLVLTENLDTVFGAGNYSINGVPTLVDDPGTISINGSFDGTSDTNLIGAGSTLAGLDTAQIRLVVDVNNVVDLGIGVGHYENQVTLTGTSPLGSEAFDVSDNGTDPDPSGNGIAHDAGEHDVTPVTVGTEAIGVAKNATVSGRQVTLDYYVENLGSSALTSVSLPDDLDAVFGAGNYQIISGPTIVTPPREFVPNTGFNGSTDLELIASGGIGIGVTEQIRVVVQVDRLINGGSGLGVYSNQVTVTANGLSDLSDGGTNPDPNGNGDPTEAGEDDPTVFTLAQEPVVGVAKRATVYGRLVTLDFYLESFANTVVSNLALTDDLAAVFGAGNYTITSAPALLSSPGTLVLNPSYDGNANSGLLSSASTLDLGETAHIQMVVRVDNVTDQGLGSGQYQNQAQVSGQSPDTTLYSDLSDSNTDPDPTGNNLPDDAGEDDPTSIVLAGSIGDSVFNDLNGNGLKDAGEPGLVGVTVYFDANNNQQLDAGESSRVTSAAGAYLFENLPAGSYRVAVVPAGIPAGFVATGVLSPMVVTLSAGQDRLDVDFGYQQQDATIGDLVWEDLDGNGSRDAGEPGLAGITVYLDANTNGVLDGGEINATSNASGAYDLVALPAGNYQVRVDQASIPVGYVLSSGNSPLAVNLAAGEDYNNADFGLYLQPMPIFTLDATPNPVLLGQRIHLTYTIDNRGGITSATGLDFSHSLPTGLRVASPANSSTSCLGGTLDAVADASLIAYSGGSVPAGVLCVVQVDVVADSTGSFSTTVGDLTSNLGNSGDIDITIDVYTYAVRSIPTLDRWVLILVALCMIGMTGWRIRRHS